MKTPTTKTLIVSLALALCAGQGAADADANIKKQLSGKTIVSGDAEFSFRRNGRITGKFKKTKFKGAWTARGGKFCRTFTEPEAWVGTECQPISFGNGTVTITGRNGPIEYTFK